MTFPRITPSMVNNSREMFPELARARKNRRSLASRPEVCRLLEAIECDPRMAGPMPALTYSLYRQFVRTGDRARYEGPYFERRRQLTAAALRAFLRPTPEALDAAADRIWALCEEGTWILPAHERGGMDLFSTETAFALAEALELLGDALPAEVCARATAEIRRQVTEPFLAGAARRKQPRTPDGEEDLAALTLGTKPLGVSFLGGRNNWTGVCASSVGAALLYCEPDPVRLARGLNLVLAGLERFIELAFTPDGASDEGVGYWGYGLLNFVPFAELLRARTGARVDLLAHPKMKLIAEFPLRVRLSDGSYYSHADCSPHAALPPGVTARLAARTGKRALLGLLGGPIAVGFRVPVLLRDLLWWDGKKRPAPPVEDAYLPAAGMLRLKSGNLVLAAKAGHNAENHNHNDVGSFVLHSGGEDLLCDAGAPAYCRDYFSPRRYELFLQARSRGHSLPVVAGREQLHGREFEGTVESVRAEGAVRRTTLEFARAYPVKSLRRLERELAIAPGGRFLLEDRFTFAGRPQPVEEAFVTWLPASVKGRTAVVRGRESRLELRLTGPAGARFALERHTLLTHERKPATLSRIVVKLPAGFGGVFGMEGVVVRRG